MKLEPIYLGDAVYAVDRGDGILLRLNNHDNEEAEIFLDSSVLSALNNYAERIDTSRKKYDA